jgi:DNA-binding winged helix-turn-helix (wHTH) protein
MKQFLDYRFDDRDWTLWRGAEGIRITRKAAGVLRCLIAQPGRLVTHDAILSSVWSGTFVQPDNIKVLVHEIRTALHDDHRSPRFIRSEPGRGYTFIAPVFESADQHDPREGSASSIFVNHEDDLSRLTSVLVEPSRSDCRVVLVEGERGIGKTAFCDAFIQRASASSSTRVAYGQALAHGGVTPPYAPVLDALHQMSRRFPGMLPVMLSQHAPSWLEQLPSWVKDAVSAPGAANTRDPSHMLRELGDLLEELGSDVATVIVLDDLQWADLETVELLRALARRHAPLRTLIVATYTPFATTVTAAALRSLAAELRATGSLSIALQPLDERDVRRYLAERFGSGAIEGLSRMVYRLAAGNPRVMVSTVDALVAARTLILDEGGWRLQHSLRTIEASLSRAVLEPVLWRFDQLDTEDRVVLESAAAIGIEFSSAAVARFAGLESPFPVARRLEALCQRGFVRRASRSAAPSAPHYGIYRFHHPVQVELLTDHAPVFDQLRAAERLAARSDIDRRFG